MRPSPLICAVLLSCGIMLLAAAAEKKATSAHTPRAIVAAEISSMACEGGGRANYPRKRNPRWRIPHCSSVITCLN
eukprot:scaffold110844_cov63-Phaeocystis_antarctica.AAC.2